MAIIVKNSPVATQDLRYPYIFLDTSAKFPNELLQLGHQLAFQNAFYDNEIQLGGVYIQYKKEDGSLANGWQLVKFDPSTHSLVPATDTIYDSVQPENFGGVIQVCKNGKWYFAGGSGVSTYDISTFDGLRKHFQHLSPRLWGRCTDECIAAMRTAFEGYARGMKKDYFSDSVNLTLPKIFSHIEEMNNYLKVNVYDSAVESIPDKRSEDKISWPESIPYYDVPTPKDVEKEIRKRAPFQKKNNF